jgi:hypothetical protein
VYVLCPRGCKLPVCGSVLCQCRAWGVVSAGSLCCCSFFCDVGAVGFRCMLGLAFCAVLSSGVVFEVLRSEVVIAGHFFVYFRVGGQVLVSGTLNIPFSYWRGFDGSGGYGACFAGELCVLN